MEVCISICMLFFLVASNTALALTDANELHFKEQLRSEKCTELLEGRAIYLLGSTTLLDNISILKETPEKISNLIYQTPTAWTPNESSLDLYTLPSWKTDFKKRPIAVFFHGGGIKGTDKNDLLLTSPKYPEFFLKKGMVFINANYRLFPDLKSTGSSINDQVIDVGRVLKWLSLNVSKYGGDPNQLTLIGHLHSSYLITQFHLNPKYLENESLSPNMIKSVIALDNSYFNIPLALQLYKGTALESTKEKEIKKYFGSTYDEQWTNSPLKYLKPTSLVKPIMLVSSEKIGDVNFKINQLAMLNFKLELQRYGYMPIHYHFSEKNSDDLFSTDENNQALLAISNFLDQEHSSKSSYKISAVLHNERKRIFDIIERTFNSSNKIPGAIFGHISKEMSILVGCGVSTLFAHHSEAPNAHSIFSIGSLTKIFTGLNLAKIYNEGIINIDTPISNFITAGSGLKEKLPSNLTFRTLVSHTSGIANMPANIFAPRDLNGDGKLEIPNKMNPAENYQVTNLVSCLSILSPDPWAKCLPRKRIENTYFYSNLGIGLLGQALVDQNINKYSSYSTFFRDQFAIPLNLTNSFARAADIHAISIELNSKDKLNSDIVNFTKNYNKSFVGLHNYQSETDATPILAPQPDMGMLAGAGEIKLSPLDLAKFLKTVLGLSQSNHYSRLAMAEFHNTLYKDSNHEIGYSTDITLDSRGNKLYSKTGVTKGSSAFIKWSPTDGKGYFILSNRTPDSAFWKNAEGSFREIASP